MSGRSSGPRNNKSPDGQKPKREIGHAAGPDANKQGLTAGDKMYSAFVA